MIGSGLNLPEADPALDFRARHGLERPFVLYVGRIDRNKGAVTLFAYFRKFLEETRGRRGPGAGGQAGGARSPTTRASATSASSARRRRWRRCGSAGSW